MVYVYSPDPSSGLQSPPPIAQAWSPRQTSSHEEMPGPCLGGLGFEALLYCNNTLSEILKNNNLLYNCM